MKYFFLIIILFFLPCGKLPDKKTEVNQYKLFDSHVHFNYEMWQTLKAKGAIYWLKKNHIKKAIVSSTPSEGSEKLYTLDKKRIVPYLRPYREIRDRGSWYKNPAIIDYINKRIKAFPYYKGFGEFHIFGKNQTQEKVFQSILTICMKNKFNLLAHCDVSALNDILEQIQLNNSNIKVIWAHSGFDYPITDLEKLLKVNKNLYLELSFREGILNENGKLNNRWKAFFTNYKNRIFIGTDTFTPTRWENQLEIVEYYQNILKQLDSDTAEWIAFKGLESFLDLNN